MKHLKLVGLALLAIFAFAGITAATASAEDGEVPTILLLSGEKESELKFESKEEKAGEVTIETEGKFLIKCAKQKYSGSFTIVNADGNLGKATVDLEGCKHGLAGCRSEDSLGDKDPAETILLIWDLHIADEKSTTNELQPLLIHKALPATGAGFPKILCGVAKMEIKGSVGCLMLPGLEEIAADGAIEILCKQKEGKQETGTCEQTKKLCEELEKDPLLMNPVGVFEKAALGMHVVIAFPVMVFIDD